MRTGTCIECRRQHTPLDVMGLCDVCAREFVRWFSLVAASTTIDTTKVNRMRKPPLQW